MHHGSSDSWHQDERDDYDMNLFYGISMGILWLSVPPEWKEESEHLGWVRGLKMQILSEEEGNRRLS